MRMSEWIWRNAFGWKAAQSRTILTEIVQQRPKSEKFASRRSQSLKQSVYSHVDSNLDLVQNQVIRLSTWL
jgi:hypothetical protein